MKILRSLSIIAALTGASTAFAQAPTPTAPAKKEAPAKPADKAPVKAPDKAPAAPAKVEVSAADTEQFLAFFNKFVDTLMATKDDCTKMATSINKLIDSNQAIIKKANVAKAQNKDLPQSAKDKMMARANELGPAMQKCGADPKVQAALQRMDDKASASAPKAAPAAPPAKK